MSGTERDVIDAKLLAAAAEAVPARALQEVVPDLSRSSLNRALARLTASGQLRREGAGRSTRYVAVQEALVWSPGGREALDAVHRPLAERGVSRYRAQFHTEYRPNADFLLGEETAETLLDAGTATQDREPAGTYLRRLLEPLLIDMSWSSSALEGNRYGLADTRELFRRIEQGQAGELDFDAQMLLNHKRAIQFMAENAPRYGLSYPLALEVHARLMERLLQNPQAPGSIRQMVVRIHGTLYQPADPPALLEENFKTILEKAELINNPIEAAFFLWVNIAYLQPFEDGNKRASRLLANIPLMILNCSPLSFIGVSRQDYADAMIAVYERNDVRVARDLFCWAYRQSIAHYREVLRNMPPPTDAMVQWHDQVKLAVRDSVLYGLSPEQAVAASMLGTGHEADAVLMNALVEHVRRSIDEISVLNAERFWLTPAQVTRFHREKKAPGEAEERQATGDNRPRR